MPDLTGVVRALQNVGVAGICLVLLWAITRGELVTKRSHEEVVAAKDQAIAELQREVKRLEAIVGAVGRGRTGDD